MNTDVSAVEEYSPIAIVNDLASVLPATRLWVLGRLRHRSFKPVRHLQSLVGVGAGPGGRTPGPAIELRHAGRRPRRSILFRWGREFMVLSLAPNFTQSCEANCASVANGLLREHVDVVQQRCQHRPCVDERSIFREDRVNAFFTFAHQPHSLSYCSRTSSRW